VNLHDRAAASACNARKGWPRAAARLHRRPPAIDAVACCLAYVFLLQAIRGPLGLRAAGRARRAVHESMRPFPGRRPLPHAPWGLAPGRSRSTGSITDSASAGVFLHRRHSGRLRLGQPATPLPSPGGQFGRTAALIFGSRLAGRPLLVGGPTAIETRTGPPDPCLRRIGTRATAPHLYPLGIHPVPVHRPGRYEIIKITLA